MHDRGDYKHGWQLERESQETEGKLPFLEEYYAKVPDFEYKVPAIGV